MAVAALIGWVSLLFAGICLPALGQTPEACRSQLRHFTVPDYPETFSAVTTTGRVHLPSRLLFSQDGIEVYADTWPNGRDRFLTQLSEHGMTVLIVYQDEAERRGIIDRLRPALPRSGMTASIDNLKYAKIHFYPKWLPSDLVLGNKMGNPLDREWFVQHIEYDQPAQCPNIFQNGVEPPSYNSTLIVATDYATHWPCEASNCLPKGPSVDEYPLWSKAFQAMLAWVKKCVALVDR
jgi:hypothetical protein